MYVNNIMYEHKDNIKYDYIDVYGKTVILFHKEEDEWVTTTLEYKTIKPYDRELVIDDRIYEVKNYHRMYLEDKIKNKELGLYAVQGSDFTLKLNMVYPIYYSVDKNGDFICRIYDKAYTVNDGCFFVTKKHKVIINLPLDIEEKLLVNNILINRKLTISELTVLGYCEEKFLDKIKRRLRWNNYIKINNNGNYYVYDDLIFGPIGKHVVK